MTSTPRSQGEVFARYLEDLNGLLRQTITDVPLVPEARRAGVSRVSFTFGAAGYAPIRTQAYGDLALFIGQVCDFTRAGRRHELHVLTYRYVVCDDGPGKGLRWDYVRASADDPKRFCNHHLQGSSVIQLGSGSFCMDALHLPTGYVPIEDVVRFCLNDLGARPRNADWHERLVASASTFRAQLGEPTD
jgi:hypothetical protein